MDKKEYIKALRYVQNTLKEKQQVYSDIDKIEIDNVCDLKRKTNIRVTAIGLGIQSILIPLIYEKVGNPFPTVVCFSIIALVIDKYFKYEKIIETNSEILKEMKKIYHNDKEEIRKIETAIEFINGLTEEEKEKYLKLKI